MTGPVISQEIAKLANSGPAQSAPWSEETRDFCSAYASGVDALPEGLMPLVFRNVIGKRGRCGFANGGTNDYLVNTDSARRYRVTVRTHWRQGIDTGQFDQVHISEAGSELYLGCTDSGSIPVASYNRSVVGELPI